MDRLSQPFSSLLLNVAEGDDPLAIARVFLRGKTFTLLKEEPCALFGEETLYLVEQAESLKEIPPTLPHCSFLFLATKMRPSHQLYKALLKDNKVIDLASETKSLRRTRFLNFIAEEARRYGKNIAPPVAAILHEHIGDDLEALVQECHKLAMYVGNKKEITAAEVTDIVPHVREENIWAFSDAIIRKDAKSALLLQKRLFDDEVTLSSLLRTVRSALQTSLQVALLSGAEVQKRFPYMKGKMLQQKQGDASRFGTSNLAKAIILLDEIELELRSGEEDEELLLELFITKVCT